MAVTVASIITNFDTYIGDTSNDRVTAAERLQLVNEATVWLQEELGNDHMVKTYTLNYYDNVHVYKVTSAIASLMEGADLRRGEEDQFTSFAHKSSRELAEEIAQQVTESSWAIERRDSNWYLVVNHKSKYSPDTVATLDSTTADGGEWEADTTNSDATNVTTDINEFKQGSGSINFDADVSQSGNNRATILNDSFDALDLSDFEDLAAFVFWIYVPDVTNFSSVTLFWGTSASAYWSATVTTDINGSAFVNGWNRVAVAWSGASLTSTPDSANIGYLRFDFNYGAGQGDDTDFRIDDLTIVRAEPLTFYYTSWYVGTNNSGTALTAYSATTDIPFYSGQYDQYKYAVAHKAASLAYYGSLRNKDEGAIHEVEAIRALNRQKKLVPTSVTKENKSFKVTGINFARGSRFRI